MTTVPPGLTSLMKSVCFRFTIRSGSLTSPMPTSGGGGGVVVLETRQPPKWSKVDRERPIRAQFGGRQCIFSARRERILIG